MLPFVRSDLAQFTSYQPHISSSKAEDTETVTQFDKLDANESPYDVPAQLKEKIVWTYQQLIETNRYPDGGHDSLRNAIASYVNESASLESSVFGAENISVGNGSDELIRSLLIATCLGGEGSILVASPTFVMYAILAQTLGIPVIDVGRNEKNFEMDLKAAQAAIEQKQNPSNNSENNAPIRAVFVVHPNSPTANPLTEAELTWLKSLPENILVVIDEAYFEFSQNTLVGELTQRPNWVVLRTFSKAFRLAAMRVGYCVAHPDFISILEKVRLPYNLPSLSLATALVAIENRQLLLESIAETQNERSKMINALSQHKALKVWDSAGNFIFLRFTPNSSSSQDDAIKILHHKLRATGTLVRQIHSGLRITVGTPSENIRTIERLQTTLKNI
ncbi:MAG: histidinol-phosphate transaminase [Scytonematopsis contorta HA4267-MV1]|jgi:histidinol-phosphate aminotransferase|nr:histidinol-phosphate transaminase [Scytonematopsis contorta HA4267-MV1]